MARIRRRPRQIHPIAELNVTNLIDLGFMLLVIFMIVANPVLQKEQTIPVDLPKVSRAPQHKANPRDRFVAVGVDASGRFYVENRNVPVDMAELRSRLRAMALAANQPVIRISGDARVPFQRMAELLNEVEKAGLTRISFESQAR